MQTTDCSGTRGNCGFDWLRNSQSLVTMPILIFYMHNWQVYIASTIHLSYTATCCECTDKHIMKQH